jgi:hypothetical protein
MGGAVDDRRKEVHVHVRGCHIALRPGGSAREPSGRDVDQRGDQAALNGAADVDQVGTVVHLDDEALVGVLDVSHSQSTQQVVLFAHRLSVTPLPMLESTPLVTAPLQRLGRNLIDRCGTVVQ